MSVSNKGQTHVGVLWILGGYATWLAALSLGLYNDHATLAQVASKDDIRNIIEQTLRTENAGIYTRPLIASSTTTYVGQQ